MAEQELDRGEPATPYKLERAREKGSVARSPEVNTLFAVAALLLFLLLWGWAATRQLLLQAAQLLRQAHRLAFDADTVLTWLSPALVQAVAVIGPLLGLLVLAALASGVLQFGLLFSAHPIKPDWQRVNPLQGFKRLASLRSLFEAGKGVLKLALLGAVLGWTVAGLIEPLRALLHADGHAHGRAVLDLVGTLVLRMLLALLLIAVLDWVFARREFARKMRMSRREMKDEARHREGDPKIKARIRELRNALRSKSRSMKNVAGADVLVTNPTHLAVALSYRHGEMPAPMIVAKGAGEMVEAMKTVARRHGVMIVENRPLARALYARELDAAVPEEHYAQVARILIWVQQSRQARGLRSRTA